MSFMSSSSQQVLPLIEKKQLHQLRLIGSFIPTIYKVFFISPGGCLRFLPSTVGFSRYHQHMLDLPPRCQSPTGVSTRSLSSTAAKTHLRGPCVAFTLLMQPLRLRSASLPRLEGLERQGENTGAGVTVVSHISRTASS